MWAMGGSPPLPPTAQAGSGLPDLFFIARQGSHCQLCIPLFFPRTLYMMEHGLLKGQERMEVT